MDVTIWVSGAGVTMGEGESIAHDTQNQNLTDPEF